MITPRRQSLQPQQAPIQPINPRAIIARPIIDMASPEPANVENNWFSVQIT